MSLTVKICGLSTEEALDAALSSGADMVGFVFCAPSPRDIAPARAARLADRARRRAEIVALVVDPDDRSLDEIVRVVQPDWLQLHGREPPDRLAAIRSRFSGLRLMKAIGIAASADLAAIGSYAAVADRLLLDAKPPRDANRPGGHGRPFDWSLLANLDLAADFMLSGGLTAGNVADAVRACHPMGVDVSSGVETAPGRKDPDLVRAFVAAARVAELQSLRVSA